MKLFGCGFNFSGNLDDPNNDGKPREFNVNVPIHVPDKIANLSLLADAKSIRIMYHGWSEVLLEIDGKFFLLDGALVSIGDASALKPLSIGPTYGTANVKYGFGDHRGAFKGVLLEDGTVWILQLDLNRYTMQVKVGIQKLGIKNIVHISIAGNEEVVIVERDPTTKLSNLQTYHNLRSLIHAPCGVLKSSPPNLLQQNLLDFAPLSLVSTQTSHALLLHPSTAKPGSGWSQILTWGDPRHPATFARTIDHNCPSQCPHAIQSLLGVSFTNLLSAGTAGGGGWHCIAASKHDNGFYIFGGRAGSDHRTDLRRAIMRYNRFYLNAGEFQDKSRKQLAPYYEEGYRRTYRGDVIESIIPVEDRISGIDEEEAPLIMIWDEDTGYGQDLKSVALGSDHLIALTRDTRTKQQHVFVMGRNSEGQLGLGNENTFDWVAMWTKMDLEPIFRRYQSDPTISDTKPRFKILDVSAGGWGSLVLVDDLKEQAHR